MMGVKIATQQRSPNTISRSIARPASTRVRPSGYHLQRTIGNSATSRLLQSHHIQTKLSVSNAGDAAEREADRVADKVMRMPAPPATTKEGASQVQARPLMQPEQRLCAECDEELAQTKSLDNGLIASRQRKEGLAPAPQVAQSVSASISSLQQSGGSPLPPATRAFFEPRFGHDFADVRVHTDARAAEASRSVNALAFTVGRDVAFAGGQYSPQTSGGKRLLAHELAHVVQQSRVDGTYDRQDQEKRAISLNHELPQTGIVQRAFNSDDNHNLQSEQFSGNDRLENIFDGKQEEFLRFGSSGDAVVKVQQTLIELGFLLLRFGADGEFGNETGSAVSKFKLQNGISPADPVVGPKTIGALDTELVKRGGVKPKPVPTCPAGPVNMEPEPLPPIFFPTITKINGNDLLPLSKTLQRPGFSVPSKPPLGANAPKFDNVKPVTVRTEPIASQNCFKCIADWELPQPRMEIFIATGDFSDEPKRSFPVQDQSVSGCPFESGATFKDVVKRVLPEAEPLILDCELEHWSDLLLTHLLIFGRYLSNVRRLTPARSHLRGDSLSDCESKVDQFLVETTTRTPVANLVYGQLGFEAVSDVFHDSTSKRELDHSAESVPPRDKKPIFPNIDRDINPLTCSAFFRRFDKTIGVKIPGPPFSSIMEDKDGDNIPPVQPWNTL